MISCIRVSGRVLENGDYDEGRMDKDNQSNVSEVIFAIFFCFLPFLTSFCLFLPFFTDCILRCPDVCPAADSFKQGLDITRRACRHFGLDVTSQVPQTCFWKLGADPV